MSPTLVHNRMQSSTRMDVLSKMLSTDSPAEKALSNVSDSPRDSLSPLDDRFNDDDSRKGVELARTASTDDSTREGQTQQQPHISFLDTAPEHEAATPALSTTACSPRSPLLTRPHRPTTLKLTRFSNGLTTISTNDLKQRICDGHTETCATITQVPRPKPKKRLPKTPAIAMGNTHSSLDASAEQDDNASLTSVVRKPMRVLRKSSTNLFKRIDSKSPLPRPLTATSIIVTTQKTSPNDDENDSPLNPFMDPAYSARESVIMPPIHSASTMTITESRANQPLSASTTIKESRDGSRSSYHVIDDDNVDSDFDDPPPVPAHRESAMSPTIPAPSPLPEDSPHKYGLKDRMDTPELATEPPEEINVTKARRRSSGLDIFNEAKSLQHAQSFLNGLSTSRRRAESTNRTNSETWGGTNATSRPGSRPPSIRPPSAMHLTHTHNHNHTHNPNSTNNDMGGRNRGHNFKSNGFAYSRALTFTQLKCYRNHARLLPSRNKAAPVECAVCHMDDDQEHWTCSWCAIRMCRYCRKDFAERGGNALRERVKQAECGACVEGSPGESVESLRLGGRGRGRAYV